MNNIYLRLIGPLLSLCVSLCVFGQDQDKPERMIVSSTTVGMGNSVLLDTYLTPITYHGWNINLRNERLQVAHRGNGKRINQQYIWANYTSNENKPRNGSLYSGFAGYSWGTQWQFQPIPSLRVAVGPYASGECGFVYNPRNSNNPASAKLSLNAGATAQAIYTLPIRRFPITVRYQVSLPVFGMFFSPAYEQSYYEIFEVGNSKNIVHFGSFHNQFNLENYLTADFPIGNLYLRIGYLGTIRNTHINDIKNKGINNSFMIGFVKQFYPFRKKQKRDSSREAVNPFYFSENVMNPR